nr:putative ribonuclease [Vibrio mimicus]
MEVVHHGGKESITGSCHELRSYGQALLIDCGLFQGADERPLEIDFAVNHLNGLVLTHAHIDHIGRLPWLLAAGFNQPIYCTAATAELVPLMLEDGLKLQLGMPPKQSERVLTQYAVCCGFRITKSGLLCSPNVPIHSIYAFNPLGIFGVWRMWRFAYRMVKWWCFRGIWG